MKRALKERNEYPRTENYTSVCFYVLYVYFLFFSPRLLRSYCQGKEQNAKVERENLEISSELLSLVLTACCGWLTCWLTFTIIIWWYYTAYVHTLLPRACICKYVRTYEQSSQWAYVRRHRQVLCMNNACSDSSGLLLLLLCIRIDRQVLTCTGRLPSTRERLNFTFTKIVSKQRQKVRFWSGQT